MLDWNVILEILLLVLLVLGGFALNMLRTTIETTIKTTAEEIARANMAEIKTTAEETARATIRELQWPAELARVLQKTRGVERQELRFKSYGALWKELRPLAIYDATDINKKTVECLSLKLSDWFFSESGGLLLTPHARGFYFALQDLLRITSKVKKEWSVKRSGGEGRQACILRKVLMNRGIEQANKVLDYFQARKFDDWEKQATELGDKWRAGIKDVAKAWDSLGEEERFATLQQVGSILRASLVNDLDSRVR
jgi:hypothetical protein